MPFCVLYTVHRRPFRALALTLFSLVLGSMPLARAQFVYNNGTATMTGGSATLTGADFLNTSSWIQNGGSVSWIPVPGDSVVDMYQISSSIFYTLSAGTLNAGVVQMGNPPNRNSAATYMTQSGGAATISLLRLGVGGSTYALSGGTLNADIVFRGKSDSPSLFRLDGGVLTTSSFTGDSTGWGNLVFNGGTLRARAGSENWTNQKVLLVVGGGGAKIDTAGYNRTISSGFIHDGNAGPTDGGLTKLGEGTLVLSGSNSFTGGTHVTGGTLQFSQTSALPGALTVNAGATGAFNVGGAGEFTSAGIGGLTSGFQNGSWLGLDTTNAGGSLTLSNALAGGFGLAKIGTGILRLTGANTYTGGTVINNGSLTVAQNNALGTGSVRVQGGTLDVEDAKAFSNDVVLAGGTYRRTVTGSLAGKVNATSDLAGGTDTTARILAGSLGTTSTLVTSFSATSAASNDGLRESDVYHFAGTGTNLFVLELSSGSLSEDVVLGWLDGNEWVNAVEGNTGNNATLAMQGFEGSYDEFLSAFSAYVLSQTIGAYGYDGDTHSVWAVLNHNSDFAVVPEPGSAVLLAVGAVALIARRRRV